MALVGNAVRRLDDVTVDGDQNGDLRPRLGHLSAAATVSTPSFRGPADELAGVA
jgi:hypothetical protein